MVETKDLCAICAWRKDCLKKFSVSGKDLRCAEFTKDFSVKNAAPQEEEEKTEE